MQRDNAHGLARDRNGACHDHALEVIWPRVRETVPGLLAHVRNAAEDRVRGCVIGAVLSWPPAFSVALVVPSQGDVALVPQPVSRGASPRHGGGGMSLAPRWQSRPRRR